MPIATSERLKLSHSAYPALQQAPDLFQTTTAANPLSPGQHSPDFQWHFVLALLRHTGPAHWHCCHSSLCLLLSSLLTLTVLTMLCLKDPAHQHLFHKHRKKPTEKEAISSLTCIHTIIHLRNSLKLMSGSCQHWCMSLQLERILVSFLCAHYFLNYLAIWRLKEYYNKTLHSLRVR